MGINRWNCIISTFFSAAAAKESEITGLMGFKQIDVLSDSLFRE